MTQPTRPIDPTDLEAEPWADPKIQITYEAALGKFLVLFNRLENMVGDILERSLVRLGRSDLKKNWKSLEIKLSALELVGLALPDMPSPNFKEIRDINGERNTLAHGHFDQNPYSGEFSLVTQGGRLVDKSTAAIENLSARVASSISDLQHCLAWHYFDNLDD